MFRFVKQIFVSAMTFFSCKVLNVNSLKFASMNNEECRAGQQIININRKEPLFYPCSIRVNKCSGSCNNIKDPYPKLCSPDVAKSLNIKVFNAMSRTNETRYIGWYQACRCKCRLYASVCNSKQHWNKDNGRCEFKECDKGFIWNPSNC